MKHMESTFPWSLTSYKGLLVIVVVLLVSMSELCEAGCGVGCGSCARRYGCMTPAWGRCCSQFFMHNGRKRSTNKDTKDRNDDMENIIEYIRLKSRQSPENMEEILEIPEDRTGRIYLDIKPESNDITW